MRTPYPHFSNCGYLRSGREKFLGRRHFGENCGEQPEPLRCPDDGLRTREGDLAPEGFPPCDKLGRPSFPARNTDIEFPRPLRHSLHPRPLTAPSLAQEKLVNRRVRLTIWGGVLAKTCVDKHVSCTVVRYTDTLACSSPVFVRGPSSPREDCFTGASQAAGCLPSPSSVVVMEPVPYCRPPS